MLLSYLNLNFTLFIILASLWGSLGCLMYSSLWKIIAYSSIYNLGWIISSIYIMNYSWIIYYLIYSLTLLIVCYSFFLFGMSYLNQLFLLSLGYTKMIFMMIMFLSMGGMPPLLGLFQKLFQLIMISMEFQMIMVYCLMMNNMFFLCLILLIPALLVMFFYLRVLFTGLMVYSISMKSISYSFNWLFYLFGVMDYLGF